MTRHEELPDHIPVFRNEKDIPKQGSAWRQHSYRIYGDSAGRWTWGPKTQDSLGKLKWAPVGDKYPPERYTVQFLAATCEAGCIESATCAHRTPITGPIVIDGTATPRGSVLSYADYLTQNETYRSRWKARRALDLRSKAREVTEAGPITMLRTMKRDAERALAAVEAQSRRLRNPSEPLAEARAVLKGLLESFDITIAKLTH